MGMFSQANRRTVAKMTVTALMWTLSIVVTFACDCSDPPLKDVRARADVAFRGTIIAISPSTNRPDLGYGHDTQKNAVFRVTRVWKGELGTTLEMPAIEETSACWGFSPQLLKVGSDLVIFAFRMPAGDDGTFLFVTSICSRTRFAKDNKDLDELGAGHEPRISAVSRRRTTYLVLPTGVVVLAALLFSALRRHRSARLGS